MLETPERGVNTSQVKTPVKTWLDSYKICERYIRFSTQFYAPGEPHLAW